MVVFVRSAAASCLVFAGPFLLCASHTPRYDNNFYSIYMVYLDSRSQEREPVSTLNGQIAPRACAVSRPCSASLFFLVNPIYRAKMNIYVTRSVCVGLRVVSVNSRYCPKSCWDSGGCLEWYAACEWIVRQLHKVERKTLISLVILDWFRTYITVDVPESARVVDEVERMSYCRRVGEDMFQGEGFALDC